MRRARPVLGLIAGVLLLLSSGMHMLLGWPNIAAQLEQLHTPADFASGLHMGWQFGGAAMIVFAAIALHTFARRLRGEAASLLPTGAIALMYIVFGAWAEALSGGEPFFLFVFVIPGLMLGLASLPDRAASAG